MGEMLIVDSYNAEFNRDIEPSWHPSIRDNYYMQFVSNMRKYKGARNIPQSIRKKININGDFSQWDKIKNEYRDDIGDIIHQNSLGCNDMDTIINNSGRNDIIISKVTEDKNYYYFYVQTSNLITPQFPTTSESWIKLYINNDSDYSNGWFGYDYIVKPDSDNSLMLFSNMEFKHKWNPICKIDFKVTGNKLHMAIPKKILGNNIIIDFKWTDNTPDIESLDILDFKIYGDVAPNGRFNYRYK